ncbi:TMV resistance protein N [Spatholobus suberectus]|nr:TMV resistance protein N [Spatholobus suberectus]
MDDLGGYMAKIFFMLRDEAELLDEIVNCILMKLNAMHAHPVNSKGLIGIEKPIAHIKSLLHQGSDDVRAIGIWSMGGIGKTTIAKEVFHRLCSEFDGYCFLANVREESQRHGIISLKEKLFSAILQEDLKIDTTNELPGYVKMRLGYMKVLIVLDDVNDSDQLEILVGACDWFGPGSRIIITGRDKQVFANEGTEAIRSIRRHLSAVTKLKLSPLVFEKISKLLFIDFHSENDHDGLDILPQGLEYLPSELRYLRWMNYPLKSLPEKFSPENLVVLDLSYSRLETLWQGERNLVNLKQVKLYGSKFLKELPDFSKAINLELLDIRFCTQLTTVHASIFTLKKLEKLVLVENEVQ